MRVLKIVAALLISLFVGGCATGSGGMKIGVENVPNGAIYARIVIDTQDPYHAQRVGILSTSFVRNDNGRYRAYLKHYPYDTYYQIADFAKRHGFKAISFEGGAFQNWMINDIEDFVQRVEAFQKKYPHRSPFYKCVLYREVPYEIFSIGVDDFLARFQQDRVPVVKTFVYYYPYKGRIIWKELYAHKIEEY